MFDQKILVLGCGYVGKGIVDFFKDHYEIEVYDPLLFGEENAERINDFKDRYRGKRVTRVQDFAQNEYDLAVVCTPTPMAEDKNCNVSMVDEVVASAKAKVILIKSTVKPGTTERLKAETGKRIVFSPEYLGEGKYWSEYKFHTDMKECPFFIFGGDEADNNFVMDLFVQVAGPTKRYFKTSAKNAEVIKYMENTYFGVKVTFANEMKSICDALGADYYTVREGWGLDPRVDKMHTMVFPDNRGFGGKCLPKDLNAIVKAAEEAGYSAEFLKAMLSSNDRFRAMNSKEREKTK
mgnify:CR=1 FL=1